MTTTRIQPPLHPILRTNHDIETEEEHTHPSIRRIANLQHGIYKTPQTPDFTLRQDAQHYCLYLK